MQLTTRLAPFFTKLLRGSETSFYHRFLPLILSYSLASLHGHWPSLGISSFVFIFVIITLPTIVEEWVAIGSIEQRIAYLRSKPIRIHSVIQEASTRIPNSNTEQAYEEKEYRITHNPHHQLEYLEAKEWDTCSKEEEGYQKRAAWFVGTSIWGFTSSWRESLRATFCINQENKFVNTQKTTIKYYTCPLFV